MTRVLLIEDNDDVRTMLCLALEQAGCEVREASDGEVGLRLYRESPADVVVTDIIMPNREGLETILAIRAIRPDAAIIAISGGGHTSMEDCLWFANHFGAARVLAKPFDPSELIAAVNELSRGATIGPS